MQRLKWIVPIVALLVLGSGVQQLASANATRAAHARVAAAAGGNYGLSWVVVGGGGSAMSSASFTLHSTAGQAAIGDMSSANYGMRSGYWQTVLQRVRAFFTYLPITLR